MTMLLLALLIGVVAGLRAMTAPAAVAWAAAGGALPLEGSWLAWMGYRWTPWIFTLLAVLELVSDQLPNTPSRTVPMQFGARLVSGALCGATFGIAGGQLIAGIVAGVIGAVLGTYGGAAARGWLARQFGSDLPAAILEDIVAVGGAALIAVLA